MLAANKTDWKIKVRLTRLWKSINSTTGDFKGYNMILLDDDVSISSFNTPTYMHSIFFKQHDF